MTGPLDLNLRHLRAIPYIARLGSMSAAARSAGLSQPALTQGLAKIEAQLRVPLFERRPGGMVATAEGQKLVQRIDGALAHLADGAKAATRGGRGFAKPDQLMTATQLRAFLGLADDGSFVAAARRLNWSQPALHRAVRDLELLSALPLIERRGRGVVLTAHGRRLARAIRLAAAELSAAIAEMHPDFGASGRLVVGAMPLSRARVLPRAIAAIVREAPGVTIDVVEGSWRDLAEPLHEGVIDLMVGALRDEAPAGLDQEALFEDRLAVVARARHPLAGTDQPTLAQLAAYPWIVGSAATPLRHNWEALFATVTPPSAPIECGSVMTARGILIDSDCLTLLSPDQVAVEVNAGLLTLIGAPRREMIRTIGLTTRTGWRPSSLQARFVALLRAA